MKQYLFHSPLGSLYLIFSQKGLCEVSLEKKKFPICKKLSESKILSKTVRELEEYFRGERKSFSLSFDITGTEFQMKVWKALQKIPYGKTISYADLAKMIKNPKAVRAVGGANGKNPLCIIIPCHRVIASDGSLGGYSGGLEMKKKLLNLEKN